MNISSQVCWCNIWDPKSICNVGPDVLCLRQGNVVKFMDMSKQSVSYFKAEAVATGIGISAFAGHDRFPLFALAETLLLPQIFVFKYPEMSKFCSLPRCLLSYEEIRFNDADILVAIGGFPHFPICVFNFRTNNLLLRQDTDVHHQRHAMLLSAGSLPAIALLDKQLMSVVSYEVAYVEKTSVIHKTSEVELGQRYLLSCAHCMCYGEDGGLYVVNDYGDCAQVDASCFALRPRWSATIVAYEGAELPPQLHFITPYKQGLLIASASRAFYIKKKAGSFTVEWTIDEMVSSINLFANNYNGELYAQVALGSIQRVVVEANEGRLEQVVEAGEPVTMFSTLQGVKDECVLLLQPDKLVITDMFTGRTLSQLDVPLVSAMCVHYTQAYVALGTQDARLLLAFYDKSNGLQTCHELQCHTPAIVALQYHDNCIVFQDEQRRFNVVNVEYRPMKLTHFFTIDEQLPLESMHILSFRLVEGPRLLLFMTRDEQVQAPGHANELWILYWGRDKKLRRRQYVLDEPYVCFAVQPPTGRWQQVELVGAMKNSTIMHHFVLSESNSLQLVSGVQTSHYGYITGLDINKNVITWGVDGVMIHFRQHKRSKKPFMISRYVKLHFEPQYLLQAKDCFNGKYLLVLQTQQRMRCMRLPSLLDNSRENQEAHINLDFDLQEVKLVESLFVPLNTKQEVVTEVYTRADIFKREKLDTEIAEFATKVTQLIDYDISVTGKTKGIFKKFCFNYKWLDAVTKEAHKLCDLERASLDVAIQDQSRIRDWIMQLITRHADSINYKVRSIFADANFENFAMLRKADQQEFDKYRFYDLEDHMRRSTISMEEVEEAPPPTQPTMYDERPPGDDEEAEEEEDETFLGFRELKPYVIEGPSIYEHMMAPIFQLQDKHVVTSNQIYNYHCKYYYYLNDPLKQEFNKFFHEAQQMKQQTMESVGSTNKVMYKIYDNMNIMLRLLHMDMFKPPDLSMPELAKDEVIERILEVDDSEITAINRRKKKAIDTGGKRGRMLLWSVEFWARALIVMMDGVIEKLWEEEIKKDIPVPEFMNKKQPHEYTLEEQRMCRVYEEAVYQLQQDRRKYLRILTENEAKTQELKTQHILKLNKRVSELMLLKLKYDFAIKQNTVRMLNLTTINYGRVKLRQKVGLLREDIDKLNMYIHRFGQMIEYWDKQQADVRTRLEAQQNRDRAIERQFRSHYLATVPHVAHEMTKLFKRRHKLSPKVFYSSLICMETTHKLTGKQLQRNAFPLSKEIHEFLAMVDEFDAPKHCPQQLDIKSWETFIKLRRLKIESEIRLRGIGCQVLDCQNTLVSLHKDLSTLKETKSATEKQVEDTTQQYLEVMRNMTLQLTLTLGQVEVFVMGTTHSLSNTVLMHVEDINEVNRQIQEAGNKKIKAMQRVAVFRRKVIFKEWEHKLYKANIAYLKFMLDAIEKCKITIEFLNILRNWDKVKEQREKYMAPGAIERVVEQKIAAFRKHIERVNIKIDLVKEKTLEIKRDSHAIDKKIERVKVEVSFQNMQRDMVLEEKCEREQKERMNKIKTHRQLMESVRKNYAHVLELQTILELLRLRTYPTLGPPLPQCHPPVPAHILKSANN